MQREERIGYVRYADDMIVAGGVDSEIKNLRFFQKALNALKLAQTSLELIRGRPRKILVLGLILSIGPTGSLETRAPFNRWKKKLTVEYIMSKMNKKKNLSAFLLTLFSLIKTRVAFAFSCSFQYSEQEIIGYFKNLIWVRVNDFLKAIKKSIHKKKVKSPFIKHYFLI